MADLYTEIITNVNAAIDTIENGGVIAAKGAHADYAENADRVGSAESADYANEVNKVSNATFATAATNTPVTIVGSCNINAGAGVVPDGTFENNGVYLAVYEKIYANYYVTTYTGVIVYKAGKNASTRFSSYANIDGGNMRVVHRDTGNHGVNIIATAGQITSPANNGTVYFYKIGNIE